MGSPGSNEPFTDPGDVIDDEADRIFDSFDSYKNGVLTYTDLYNALARLKLPCTTTDVTKLNLHLAGKDWRDGVLPNQIAFVTKSAFREYIRKNDKQFRDLFRGLDKNGDGVLDRRDFTQALQEIYPHLSITDETIGRLVRNLESDEHIKCDGNDSWLNFDRWYSNRNQVICHNITYSHWLKIMALLSLAKDDPTKGIVLVLDITTPPTTDRVRALTPKWIASYLLAGGIAGSVSRTITAPLDRIKTLVQAKSDLITGGFIKGIQNIYKDGGARSFWRGNGINVLKIIPESSLMFTFFEIMKACVCEDSHQPSFYERFLSAGTAGLLTGTIVYPLETTKTRLITAPTGNCSFIDWCDTLRGNKSHSLRNV
eukprot:TRINITY_DN9184_c0_g1_i1.p1 TRINITY_DN9184_c0_g1~~TRINITY_DN9184_c0_g1_i1.p1  ORF type:complete len:370 (+),score=59.92 TRINITY_DN9184_c0_g1_i1:122-1231(+)